MKHCVSVLVGLVGLVVVWLGQPFVAWAQGPYVLPFYNPAPITCGFGCYNGHAGTDYGVPYRTPVVAAASGQLWQYYFPSPNNYGHLAVVTHGNGMATRYGHLDEIIVPNGFHVNQGQVIGYSGNSGGPWCQSKSDSGNCTNWASPYHLHFEVRINTNDNPMSGTAIDPYSAEQYSWTSNPPVVASAPHVAAPVIHHEVPAPAPRPAPTIVSVVHQITQFFTPAPKAPIRKRR